MVPVVPAESALINPGEGRYSILRYYGWSPTDEISISEDGKLRPQDDVLKRWPRSLSPQSVYVFRWK